MNPIAQAVARKQVHDSIVSTRINLHMLEEGEPCGPLLNDMAFLLSIMAAAQFVHTGFVSSRPIADAVAVLETTDEHWKVKHLPLFDLALGHADHLYQTLPGTAINKALQNFHRKIVDMP